MKNTERAMLLLTCPLGDLNRKPLTAAQFRELTRRMQAFQCTEPDRDLQVSDLMSMGYGEDFAGHILNLLEGKAVLEGYLSAGKKLGIRPVARVSENYPLILRKRFGLDAPGVLWAKGDLSLLEKPAIALVGSRELRQENRIFAEEAGRQAALQGITLVSGNARGADRTAQEACLEAGGSLVCVTADALMEHEIRENVLYICETGYEMPFSAQRALSRNRIIHALGWITLVAQATLHKGGTWDGAVKNLRHGWSPVAIFRDGSKAAAELEQLGAYGISLEDLKDLSALADSGQSSFLI